MALPTIEQAKRRADLAIAPTAHAPYGTHRFGIAWRPLSECTRHTTALLADPVARRPAHRLRKPWGEVALVCLALAPWAAPNPTQWRWRVGRAKSGLPASPVSRPRPGRKTGAAPRSDRARGGAPDNRSSNSKPAERAPAKRRPHVCRAHRIRARSNAVPASVGLACSVPSHNHTNTQTPHRAFWNNCFKQYRENMVRTSLKMASRCGVERSTTLSQQNCHDPKIMS